jgi:aryl-alcohol dehydrogenase-like predicted oxidoreductase
MLSQSTPTATAGTRCRKNLRLSLETSLRRLRTDYIDIYWVHMWDRNTPAEETMRALDDQVRREDPLRRHLRHSNLAHRTGKTLAAWGAALARRPHPG